MSDADETHDRADSLEQYKVLIDEYRFNTQFSWDRTKNVVTLVVTVLGVATGLLKVEGNQT